MKRNTISKSALACLVTGLLFTTITPIFSRYYPVPDVVKGFITGLGLALEIIALVRIQKSRKDHKCSATQG